MKKITLSLAMVGAFFFAHAQEVEKPSDEELAKRNWFHANFATDSIYGTASTAAYEYAESKGLKASPVIVAVIDSGVEITHDDLKNVLWTNKDEIPGNGIDDDKNGYIDDVHGWNFIGGADGSHVNEDQLEITRLVKKGMDMFESPDEFTNETNKKKYPKKYEEYKMMKIEVEEALAKAKATVANYEMQIEGMLNMFQTFADEYGADKTITVNDLKSFNSSNEQVMALKNSFMMAAGTEKAGEVFGQTPAQMLADLQDQLKDDKALKYYKGQMNHHYNVDFDSRHIVGDNYEDKTEKYYGNADVDGPDSFHGSHVAGIIGAENGNGIGIDGVARNVKIMAVRSVPDGDERDKDIANSIRYAVDNGAKILNMSFGKAYSPEKELVWDAIKYATDKGVLMVHAAGNDNKDIDVESNFPTNYRDGKEWSNSWLTVGASSRYNDKIKASFSNFGKKQVDIFGPGVEIYSTVPKNTYDWAQGTSMAAPAVAGVAALVWSYYPRLTASELRTILIESGNAHPALEGMSINAKVVDALKALKMAETYAKK